MDTLFNSHPIDGLQCVPARFDGADYQHERDSARLTGQLLRIVAAMRDGQWRTLNEIATATGDPVASISAQLRHLRKARFGGNTVNRKYLGDGLYSYQLILGQRAIMANLP